MMLIKLRDFARRFMKLEHAPTPPPVQLPDNDDILREILLRLPALPSSLPRASLVCKRWCHLISDPSFLRHFRKHHRAPPLLGYFYNGPQEPVFTPTLVPPNYIPPKRFTLPQQPAGERLFFLGCRHGLALLINRRRLEAIVWDPVTSCQATIAYPPEFTVDNRMHCCRGAVLSSDGIACSDGHLRPFKLILISIDIDNGRTTVYMCLYESTTGKWSKIISTVIRCSVANLANVLVGDTLCGFFHWPNGILKFDLGRQSLETIHTPKIDHSIDNSFFRVVRTEDGGLGLAILSQQRIQLWGRKVDSDGDKGWVLRNIIELDKLFSLMPSIDNLWAKILGYDEDNNVIHLSMTKGVMAIQLESTEFDEVFNGRQIGSDVCYPYTSFYTGWRVAKAEER